jgi:hypothetical protein
MKTTQHRSIVLRALPAGLLAASAMMSAYTPTAAGNDSAAYAFGGLLAGHLLTDMRFRQQQQAQEQKQQTEALTSMAYGSGGGAARPSVAPHAPAAYSMTPEQKLNQLDKLAAGGYITPAEYKARRQAILDSM